MNLIFFYIYCVLDGILDVKDNVGIILNRILKLELGIFLNFFYNS